MSQSVTELEQLRARCKHLVESESQARVELEQTQELLNQASAELKTTRELESMEIVREGTSGARKYYSKLNLSFFFILFSWMT